MPLSAFLEKSKAAIGSQTSPWVWVAVVFGLQTIGSLFVARHLGIPLSTVGLPIILLLIGTMLAVLIERHHHSGDSKDSYLWFPGTIYALFIFSLSHMSFPNVQVSFDTSLFHPVEYMTLGLFLCLAWYSVLNSRGTIPFVLLVVAVGTLFGISDEAHQFFIPGRSASAFDLGPDVAGICAGCWLFLTARSFYYRLVTDFRPLS